jgi:predicted transcriptional regulator
MSKSIVVTARVDEQLSADLDRLSAMRERSRAWIIERAIAEFVRADLELRDSLAEAEAEIDRGEYYTQEQMEDWLSGLQRAEAAE